MILSSQSLAFLTSSIGLLSINFAVAQPAKASILCEPGTVTNHSNGSLASCSLGQDMTVQIYSSKSGANNFPCKAQGYIRFDNKSQFQSCKLSQEIQIRRGNSIEICPTEYKVNVSFSEDGTQSFNCQPYTKSF
jgi:hypothetical protein